MSSANEDPMQCPLCSYKSTDSYQLTLHVEETHFADDSPFVAEDDQPNYATSPLPANVTTVAYSNDLARRTSPLGPPHPCPSTPFGEHEGEWVPCQEEECGELVLWKDLSEHLYLHAVEISDEEALLHIASQGYSESPPQTQEKLVLGRRTASSDQQQRPPSSYSSPRRLGKDELGPYAYEKKMPRQLLDLLSRDGRITAVNRIGPDHKVQRFEFVENKIKNVVPMLAKVLNLNSSTVSAQLCHPVVQHIFKLPNEGSFCGYRNIQMLHSFIKCGPAVTAFGKLTDPNILDIQNLIEQAWENGYDDHGRIETGGIRGTRKYIGTPEAKALFDYLAIPNRVEYCYDLRLQVDSKGKPTIEPAYHSILKVVEAHFASSTAHPLSKPDSKATITIAPPIYLQLRGHSMTIVGLEKTKLGSANLLVFDPSYGPPQAMRKLLGLPGAGAGAGAAAKATLKKRPVSELGRGGGGSRTVWSWSGADASTPPPLRQEKGAQVQRVREGSSLSPSSSSSSSQGRRQDGQHSQQATGILRAYRRGAQRFARHKECELLFVDVEVDVGAHVDGQGDVVG